MTCTTWHIALGQVTKESVQRRWSMTRSSFRLRWFLMGPCLLQRSSGGSSASSTNVGSYSLLADADLDAAVDSFLMKLDGDAALLEAVEVVASLP
eukprot:6473463-Amphidinium_carterae.1